MRQSQPGRVEGATAIGRAASWSPPIRNVALGYGGVLDAQVPGSRVDFPQGYEGFVAVALAESRLLRQESLPVDPAAAEAVQVLAGLGLGVLVASNTLPGQSREQQLAAAGVDELLDAVVESEHIGVAKPDRVFFDMVVAAAGGCVAAEVCYVGHRVETDIGPAVAAGMRAVLVTPSAPTLQIPASVPVIGHVAELPGLFARAAGRAR
ncbi:HAD family hydrolase [Actinomadura graeca]|uniref:HAD family hydrolase n=1 Tax=Actinomadura graeca TaxID=2750812 RepID=A0ABX8R486_9ACTN|nr:HAD family hydrolase [Actinomadura graeca]QXJ25850.1 HAD family hydrolase [Actinomadura graeca]